MLLYFRWVTCPQAHKQLSLEDELKKAEVYCEKCNTFYTQESFVLGETEVSSEALPLRG